MTDEELVHAFETRALGPGEFTHASHVRVAWCYLRRVPFFEAMARFVSGLKAVAAAHGKPDRYHETITVAYLLLIAERIDETGEPSWGAFAARHDDLLAQKPSILARYYTAAALESEQARREFVMPDVPSTVQRTLSFRCHDVVRMVCAESPNRATE